MIRPVAREKFSGRELKRRVRVHCVAAFEKRTGRAWTEAIAQAIHQPADPVETKARHIWETFQKAAGAIEAFVADDVRRASEGLGGGGHCAAFLKYWAPSHLARLPQFPRPRRDARSRLAHDFDHWNLEDPVPTISTSTRWGAGGPVEETSYVTRRGRPSIRDLAIVSILIGNWPSIQPSARMTVEEVLVEEDKRMRVSRGRHGRGTNT